MLKINFRVYSYIFEQENQKLKKKLKSKNAKNDVITSLAQFLKQPWVINQEKLNDEETIIRKKTEINSKFSCEVQKSIQNNSNYIHKQISKYKKSGSCINHSYKYIPLYTRSNVSEVNKQFDLFQRNKNIDSLVREGLFIPKELDSNYSQKSFIAQNIFGSLSRWWTAQCKNKVQLLY